MQCACRAHCCCPARLQRVMACDADVLPHAAAGVRSDMLTYVNDVHILTAEELSALRHPLVVLWCVDERLFTTTLAQLARQVPSICATEAQSERAASHAGLIDAVRSARLSPDRLSAVTMAKSWTARRFADELPPALPASMMQRGGTSAKAAALAAMGGGGEAPALGELNGVDEGGIHLAVIDIDPAVINDDGKVDAAVATQPMNADDDPANAPTAPAAAGGAGGGGEVEARTGTLPGCQPTFTRRRICRSSGVRALGTRAHPDGPRHCERAVGGCRTGWVARSG
jgi:hypothetical protein